MMATLLGWAILFVLWAILLADQVSPLGQALFGGLWLAGFAVLCLLVIFRTEEHDGE